MGLTGTDGKHYLGIQSPFPSEPHQFNFQEVGGSQAVPSFQAPSLTVFDGRLYYAYTGADRGRAGFFLLTWGEFYR